MKPISSICGYDMPILVAVVIVVIVVKRRANNSQHQPESTKINQNQY